MLECGIEYKDSESVIYFVGFENVFKLFIYFLVFGKKIGYLL